ncbi:MAG: DUF465 domain-containing protein [Nitrospinota bacterium]
MPFSINDEKLAQKLIDSNEEFKQLFDEHKNLDIQVNQLFKKRLLSSEDENQLAELKKLKLKGRDEMQRILNLAKESAS